MEIYKGDCLDIIPTLKGKNISLVLVDLPYGQTSCEWDKVIDLDDMWKKLNDVCNLSCMFIFFCTVKFGNDLINSKPNYFRYDLVWEKSHSVGHLSANKAPLRKHEMIYVFGKTSSNDLKRDQNKELRDYSKKIIEFAGFSCNDAINLLGSEGYSHFYGYRAQQFTLPTKKNYNKVVDTYNLKEMEGFLTHEEMKAKYVSLPSSSIYNAQKTKGKPYKMNGGSLVGGVYGSNLTKTNINNKGDRFPTSILKFSSEQNTCHLTQKPVKLCEWLINTYSNKDDVVLDFTMGSGTTGIACKNTGRKFIGIEKDPEIFEIAKKRLE